MENKKLGLTILIISLLLFLIIIRFIGELNTQAQKIGCFGEKECKGIESNLGIAHVAFGIMGAIFALGFYLIFFSKSEEAILKRLEDEKSERSEKEKFELISKGLDNYEKNVLGIVKEQDGITQNTLRIKANMSKAKLSYVINDLEKKGFIKRIKKGKTFAVYIT